MDRHSGKSSTLSFPAVSVGKCHIQTATDRYGDEAKSAIRDRERAAVGFPTEGLEEPFTWPNADTDDAPPGAKNSIYGLVPSMQSYRNNLAALSHGHNLYFVAYQGHIFIYVPRSVPKQRIPQDPDFRIYPPPSKEAVVIGGTVDIATPHTINHIITGYLGEQEIVLACYDDGDVVAYYVKDMADWIESKRNQSKAQRGSSKAYTSRPPRLLFHENVGQSAWGLAIHRKSRLIAVSSNRSEVTVFAFALASCRNKSRKNKQACDCCQSCDSPKSGTPRRARNWRIVVALREETSNIPNVSFLDDVDGQAEKVCAVDIKGALYIADIWRMFQPVIKVDPFEHDALRSEEFWPAPSRGWGILPLANGSFVPVDSVEEMFGLPQKTLKPFLGVSKYQQPMTIVTECLAALPDNPCPPATGGRPGQFYHYVPVTLHDEFLNFMAGNATMAAFTDDEGDESETEPEALVDEDEDEDVDEEEDGDDHDEGGAAIEGAITALQISFLNANVPFVSTSLEEEAGEAAAIQDAIVSSESPQMANQNGDLPFGGTTPGAQSQQALQDIEETMGQLAHAVQEFQGGISPPPSPGPVPHPQDEATPKHERDGNFDSASSGQHNYSQLNTPLVRLDMAFFPHNGNIQLIPRSSAQLLAFLNRPIMYNEIKEKPVAYSRKDVTKRYHFIRTYEKDLELRSLRGSEAGWYEIGVMCPNAVTFGSFHQRILRPYFRATSRLSMIAHIPELSLVVLGSPIGRVLLVTPTKLGSPVVSKTPWLYWHHGLRVEYVLPRQSDEDKFRSVLRPLHGLAVGPLQSSENRGGDLTNGTTTPKRFRLMLHYRNHDILTYELTREDRTGRLGII
ncbi:CRT10 domain-containing protein [Trichoderma austrokoningii]